MIVADIMSKQVHTVTPDTKLTALREIFASVSYHHLLVEENCKLIGVISDRDVLANLSPFIGTMGEQDRDRELLELSVENIMSTKLITIEHHTLIDTASILLLENNISCLPVVDSDLSIEGIVSWKDILQYHVYGVDTTLDE